MVATTTGVTNEVRTFILTQATMEDITEVYALLKRRKEYLDTIGIVHLNVGDRVVITDGTKLSGRTATITDVKNKNVHVTLDNPYINNRGRDYRLWRVPARMVEKI